MCAASASPLAGRAAGTGTGKGLGCSFQRVEAFVSKTIDERVEVLESVAFRHSHHLNVLAAVVPQVNGKLDDLSGQVREVKLSVRELGDRVANVEATLTEHTGLLQAILAKLNA